MVLKVHPENITNFGRHLAIDGEVLAADGKLWRKKAWQATLGRVGTELDQLQGSTITNYLPAAYHFYNSPDQLEP